MKLQVSTAGTLNAFTAYGDGYVTVNGKRHAYNLIVMPESVKPWGATTFDALTEDDFAVLAGLGAEIVLFGTGQRLRFPHPRLTRPLVDAGLGLEVMDLRAACRTYNVLVAEHRKVAAALLLL